MITPVLLCGGAGTRLWPLSRKGFPKQFTRLMGERSLFSASAARLSGDDFAAPIVVTAADFRFVVAEQLLSEGIEPAAVLIEPAARNTAPSVLAAALHVYSQDPNSLILVAPSDHSIPDTEAFRSCIRKGIRAAQAGMIVTFGVVASRAETGYGWLELDEAARGDATPLLRFIEKPGLAAAQGMLSEPRFLWNAGIFLATARVMVEAFEKHAADIVEPVRAALGAARSDLGFLRLDEASWLRVKDVSVDYAVMEKVSHIVAVRFEGRWNDLGGWDAVALEMGADASGNSIFGPATALDCEGTLLRSESNGVELVGIGLKGIVAVAMGDAVLVVDRSRTQDVKKAVDVLREKGVRQADLFLKDHRPWGWFETLALEGRFQVKRIVVKPGASLSLQSHYHRAEHWIVVQGTARVTIDGDIQLVTENQSIYVPLGAVHRMENPGKVPMVLIEVQTGIYLGEDDIIRYDDVYARGAGARG